MSLRRLFGKEDTTFVMPLLLPITSIWSHVIMPNVLKRGGVYALDDVEKVVASLRSLDKDSPEWAKYAEQRKHFVGVEIPKRRASKLLYARFMIQQRLLDPKMWMDAKAIYSQ
jgi:hypothetical protein